MCDRPLLGSPTAVFESKENSAVAEELNNVTLTVFAKPWRFALPMLAKHISALGFDGVELPVRPGYPVTPENVGAELAEAARIPGDHGLKITSIAGPTDESTLSERSGTQVTTAWKAKPRNPQSTSSGRTSPW